MSWAEVKKFINSGRVPLNELIEPVDAVETFKLVGTAYNELKTVLDITGAGRLHYVTVTNRTKSNSRIIVTVDGTVVFDGGVVNTDTYPNLLHLGKNEHIQVVTNCTSSQLGRVFTPTIAIEMSTGYRQFWYDNIPFNATYHYKETTGEIIIAELTAPIRFKESLKIEIKGTSTNDTYGLLYDLG